MRISPEAVVTTVAIAEELGIPDEDLRSLADLLKADQTPVDLPLKSVWRMSAAYCAIRRTFGRAEAMQLIDQTFTMPEHKPLIRALHQVSPCIVPLDLD